MHRSRISLVAVAAGLLVAGCRDESVQVYRAPKEGGEAPSNAAHAGSTGSGASSEPTSKPPWVVPQGWAEKPSASGSRIASYGITGSDGRSADVSVSVLNGTGGGALENVNLWRNQLGLGPVTLEELGKLSRLVRIGSREAVSYELVGERAAEGQSQTNRTLVAIMPAGEMTVFFKLTGEQALVAENREKYLEWLKSVNTGEDTADAPASGGASAPAASAGGTSPGAGADASGLPQWTVPTGWQREGERPMRLATFSVPGEPGGKASDLSISTLGGDGGGMLANVNRWRGQLGLTPWGEDALQKEGQVVDVNGTKVTVVDLVGDKNPQGEARRTRILAAVAVRGGASWFYKLTGDDAAVVRERENFMGFVRSIRY